MSKSPMKLDLSTGEATIPREIEYIYVTILNWYEEDKEKLRQKGLNKKMNYDVGESLQIKRGGKPLLKTLSLKRYQSMPEIIKM